MAGLNTAEYDKKGRCVRHSNIRLRKKKIFGGWKISEFGCSKFFWGTPRGVPICPCDLSLTQYISCANLESPN